MRRRNLASTMRRVGIQATTGIHATVPLRHGLPIASSLLPRRNAGPGAGPQQRFGGLAYPTDALRRHLRACRLWYLVCNIAPNEIASRYRLDIRAICF